MKIKLSDTKELFVKSKKDLIKHKEELKEEDKRKQKIYDDIQTLKDIDPELQAFANMQLTIITPPEEYKIIDEAIESF